MNNFKVITGYLVQTNTELHNIDTIIFMYWKGQLINLPPISVVGYVCGGIVVVDAEMHG